MTEGVTFGRIDPDGVENRFQLLRRELGVTTFGMNLIVLAPGERGRIHHHERQEEVFLVLEGTLTLAVDGEEHDLGTGELARVAPPVRRQLVNRGPGRLVLLALGGAHRHEGRDGVAFAAWDATQGAPPPEVPLPEDLPPSKRRTA
jgi:uncharacterized cupin superfamily protein